MLSAALALVLAGCTTKRQWQQTIQPVRSLDEIYALQGEVNDHARPFVLGSGDRVGTHAARTNRWVAARQE